MPLRVKLCGRETSSRDPGDAADAGPRQPLRHHHPSEPPNPPSLLHLTAERGQAGNSLLRAAKGNLCFQKALYPRGKRKAEPPPARPAGSAGGQAPSEHQPPPSRRRGPSPSPPCLAGASPAGAAGKGLVPGGKTKAQKPQKIWVEARLFPQPPPPCISLLVKPEINSTPHTHPYFSFRLALCTCTKAIK